MYIDKKTKLFFLVMLFLYFSLVLSINANNKPKSDDGTGKLEELHFFDGKLIEDYLPFYKNFIISGNTHYLNQKVDVAKLIIIEMPGKSGKIYKRMQKLSKKIIKLTSKLKEFNNILEEAKKINKIFLNNKGKFSDFFENLSEVLGKFKDALNNNGIKSKKLKNYSDKMLNLNKKLKETYQLKKEVDCIYWKRNDDDVKKFKLLVESLKGWKTNYILEFTFYKKPDKNDKVILDIIDDVVSKMGIYFKKFNEVSETSAKRFLTEEINEFLLEKKQDGEIILIENKKELDKKYIKEISNIIRPIPINKKLRDKKIKKYKKCILNLSEKDLSILEVYLKSALNSIKKDIRKKLFLNEGVIDLFINIIINLDKNKKPLEILKEIQNDDLGELLKKIKNIINNKKLTEADKKKFSNVIIDKLNKSIEKLTKLNEIRETNRSYLKNTEKAKEKINNLLSFYIQDIIGSVYFNVIAWPANKTELDNILIGTSYGLGVTALSIGENTETEYDTFSFVGLKFYLGPVDKSRHNPFLGKFSRFSLTFSMLVGSKISYKGQEQKNLFGGLKPMFGLSYDLNSQLAVNAGVMFFKQPSINPLADENTGEEKMSVFIGLSFDFDIINKIKGLIKP